LCGTVARENVTLVAVYQTVVRSDRPAGRQHSFSADCFVLSCNYRNFRKMSAFALSVPRVVYVTAAGVSVVTA
jgi:hypothetical protein